MLDDHRTEERSQIEHCVLLSLGTFMLVAAVGVVGVFWSVKASGTAVRLDEARGSH